MGAEIEVRNGYIHAKAKRLRGCRLVLDLVTVTGITAASKVYDGKTSATLNTSNASLSGEIKIKLHNNGFDKQGLDRKNNHHPR